MSWFDIASITSQTVDSETMTSNIYVPWDSSRWDNGVGGSGGGVYMVDDIGTSVRLTPDEYIIRGLEAQYVTIDRSSINSNLWSLHNSWVHKDSYAWSGQTFPNRQGVRPIIEFIRDIGLYPGQIWSESTDPLFMLYDIDNVALNDPGRYPGSNFTGNRIFGYAASTGPIDPILVRSLSFDANGYPLFNNDAFTIQYTYVTSPITTAPITSLYCYVVNNGGNIIGSISGTTLTVSYVLNGVVAIGQTISNVLAGTVITAVITGSNGIGTYTVNNSQTVGSETLNLENLIYNSLWHPAANTTTQGITNNFYDIPLNLEANPLWDDVTTISESTWIVQFDTLIGNQLNLTGNPLSDNNYRDTLRDLSLGAAILQHRAPLLKAMLTASDTEFDVPQSIEFADREYNKFRNAFVRMLVTINNNGTLAAIDPTINPNPWVLQALNLLKRGKSINFPFAYSTMAGGQYFIPPTPASLGVSSNRCSGICY